VTLVGPLKKAPRGSNSVHLNKKKEWSGLVGGGGKEKSKSTVSETTLNQKMTVKGLPRPAGNMAKIKKKKKHPTAGKDIQTKRVSLGILL